MLAMWSAVARDAPVGRFGQREFVAYFLAALVVRLMTGAWVIWELNYEIRQGTLAFRLLRPVHPLLVYACENVAAMPLRALLSLPVALVLLFSVGGTHLTRDPLLWALFPVSVIGAWLITFMAMSLVGALAFYVDSAGSLFEIWMGLFGVFSGYLVPLELFPPWLATAARALPFRYMLAFPVEMVIGMLGRGRALTELGVQWLFVGLLGTAAAAAWRLGLRRFAAFGG
jgi:ABC-2 type transport system permease protein